jgi:hypothetical protein
MAPFTDDERDQVRRLHAAGTGRNEIARQTGIHQRRVSAIAADLGLTFKRSPHVAAAAEAKKVDAKARRAALALKLLEDAERLRESLWQTCTAYNFGGKDNTFEQVQLSEPSFRDKQHIMTSIGLAIDRAVKLDAYDRADESLSGLDVWLATFAGGGK